MNGNGVDRITTKYRIRSTKYRSGFTIIELLITMFLISTVVTGLFGLFVLALRSAQESERRVVAIALANEKAEMIRNLPYMNVGTEGGIPAGSIPQQEDVEQNGLTYQVKTDIRYIDDPFDGTAGGLPSDILNADYKQARIEVTWNSPSSAAPILLISTIAPQGIEGGEAAGTLVFQALDVLGQAVAGAELRLINDAVTPNIDINTLTDNQGQAVIPGLPVSSDSYELILSKSDYTSEQSYDRTATFIPDADHSHLSAILGQITNKTFFIDRISSLNIRTIDPDSAIVPSVAYHIQGTKTIGADQASEPVYLMQQDATTNTSGTATHDDLVWDAYSFSINGATTGYDIKETSLLLPVVIDPNEDVSLDVTLVPHTPISLHVSVATTNDAPIDNATIHLTGPSTDETSGTGVVGQVFFEDLPQPGDFSLDISAPGFQGAVQVVPVVGSERIKVQLVSSA